jgi:hypothetical protein
MLTQRCTLHCNRSCLLTPGALYVVHVACSVQSMLTPVEEPGPRSPTVRFSGQPKESPKQSPAASSPSHQPHSSDGDRATLPALFAKYLDIAQLGASPLPMGPPRGSGVADGAGGEYWHE